MEIINWIIIKSKDRGIDYGVGTFIKQLSQGLALLNDIDVFVIEVGDEKITEFSIEKKTDITYFKFPKPKLLKDIDTITNYKRFAKSIVRIVLSYLPIERKNVVHMNFVFQYFIGAEFKSALDCKLIFTQHLFIPEIDTSNNSFDTERQTYSLVDRIVTVTKHGKDHLVNKFVDEGKITTIFNGIDSQLFSSKNNEENIRQKYGIGLNERIVLYSGRIDPIKGLKYLTLSFSILLKKIPNCRLVIAGNGDYEELIQGSKAFSSNINYLGFIPLEDLIALYHEASIGVIPSLEEHCSYVALEMLHCGLPVVATCLGGLKEIFSHNENAFLVDTIPDQTNIYGIAPNINQLANYMFNLLADDQLRKIFSRNAIIMANDKFSADKMVNNYVRSITN